MSARFCFKYCVVNGEHFTGSFKSADGDEYAVEMKSEDYSFNNFEHFIATTLTIEWKKQSSKLIKVSAASQNRIEETANKYLFVDNKVRITIPYDFGASLSNRILVVIDIAPCIHERPVVLPVDEKLTPTKEPIAEKQLEKLSTDIKNFLQTGELSDVVLTDGSKEIRAHKFILSARSPVFAKMFQHPMKENRENRITIKDISHEVLKELIYFMYAGTIVIRDSIMARDLYVAADKYDVRDLRDVCASMLKSVDLNNALDTLLLADLYSDKMLKEAALEFISHNYSQMKITQSWNSFMKKYHNLAVEILSFVIDKKI